MAFIVALHADDGCRKNAQITGLFPGRTHARLAHSRHTPHLLPMSEENQIEVPPSFTALYADRSGQRLRAPMAEVRQRYEACEDLATHLTEHARILAHVEVPSEDEVLQRIHAGLRSEGAGVTHDEARWVVLRLAELLGWQMPELGV